MVDNAVQMLTPRQFRLAASEIRVTRVSENVLNVELLDAKGCLLYKFEPFEVMVGMELRLTGVTITTECKLI
jgi:hypothetical protein